MTRRISLPLALFSVTAFLCAGTTAPLRAQSQHRKIELPKDTVIIPAPRESCALLDVPAKRNLMDGLLFNLLWSCGRQFELGPVTNAEAESVDESAESLRLITAAATTSDVLVNNPVGESGTSTPQSETSMARNPLTGTLCSAFNDSSSLSGFTGFSRSTNNGVTWADNGAVGSTAFGDPSLVWRQADGYFYLATLGSGGSLALWVSTNDCQTFNFVSNPSTVSDDKEMLAVDNNPSSPNYGFLYLVWTDFGVAGSPIRAIRSTDGGATWSGATTVSTGGTVQGAWPAVAPNGDVFVAWLSYTDFQNGPITVQVARSTNGGLTYATVTSPLVNAVSPRQAAASTTCARPSLNGNLRYLASPQIAVDRSGVLHVVYSYDPDGFNVGDVVNVYYRRSTDSGASWSTEVRLNDDATTRDQYFPTIQVNGPNVMAAWYDRRLDGSNLLQDYYKRVSTDGGLTWRASERVSDASSPIRIDPNMATCYHGDYDQSLVTTNNTEVVQWADDRRVSSAHNDADVYADAVAPLYEGYHDTADCSSFVGWAWDMNLPNDPISVDLFDGSNLLATVPANQFRQDLLNAGKGNGVHGFGYFTPTALKNAQWHSITARFGGTSTNLNWTPRSIICGITIFTTQVPGNFLDTAGQVYTVATQFGSANNGEITHLRFYRAVGESGTNVGKLWTDTGTFLGQVTFPGTPSSGWVEAELSPHIAITAGTRYRVAVNTNVKQSKTDCGIGGGITNGPLTAYQGFWIAGNGIFPTTSSCSNFFADVKFNSPK
jgi:hypothetical protein